MTNLSIKLSSKVILGSLTALLYFGCSGETSVEPIKPLVEQEGTAEAAEVSLDFEHVLFKSAKEVHSYSVALKDGVASGTFEVYNFDVDGQSVSDAHGDVICMVFEEDCKTVRFIGKITSGSDTAYPGKYAVWTVVDDGQVTQTTDLRYPVDEASATHHCEVGLDFSWYGLKSYFPTEKLEIVSKSCN